MRSKYYIPDDENDISQNKYFDEEVVTHWAEINPDGSITAEVRVIIHVGDGRSKSAVRKIRLSE